LTAAIDENLGDKSWKLLGLGARGKVVGGLGPAIGGRDGAHYVSCGATHLVHAVVLTTIVFVSFARALIQVSVLAGS
jgi:hypothetical protein